MGLHHHYLPLITSSSDITVGILKSFPSELATLSLLSNDVVESEKPRCVSKQIIVIQGTFLLEPILCHFIRILAFCLQNMFCFKSTSVAPALKKRLAVITWHNTRRASL